MNEALESRLEEIERSASRQRAAAEYIAQVIASDRENLESAFVPSDTSPGFVDEVLFENVESSFKKMQEDALRTIGVVYTQMARGTTGEDFEPTVRLGWRQYVPMFPPDSEQEITSKEPHVLRLTDKGLFLINSWRSAQGYVSLQEQRQINQQSWQGAKDAARRELAK